VEKERKYVGVKTGRGPGNQTEHCQNRGKEILRCIIEGKAAIPKLPDQEIFIV